MNTLQTLVKSRTFWTLVAAFVYNVWQLVAPSIPAQYSALVDFVFTSVAAYFHINPSQNYSGNQTPTQPPQV